MKGLFYKQINWIIKDKYKGKILKEKLKKDIKRLKKKEPVDYIIGYSEFLNCRIDLSLKPFIPRQETEYWTEQAIKFIKQKNKSKIYVLDLFSGSGCIGIAVLKNIKNSYVDFGEIRKNFIKQIKLNLSLNKISKFRYNIIKTDIFSNIKKTYDFILANPPYISKKMLSCTQKSVLFYEPFEGFYGGKDGLDYIKRFLKDAKNYVKKGGYIYMEFSPEQKEKIKFLLKKLNYKTFCFKKDQYKKPRFIKIKI